MLYVQSAITVISVTTWCFTSSQPLRLYQSLLGALRPVSHYGYINHYQSEGLRWKECFYDDDYDERSVSYHEQDYDDFENYGYYYSCYVLMRVMRNRELSSERFRSPYVHHRLTGHRLVEFVEREGKYAAE